MKFQTHQICLSLSLLICVVLHRSTLQIAANWLNGGAQPEFTLFSSVFCANKASLIQGCPPSPRCLLSCAAAEYDIAVSEATLMRPTNNVGSFTDHHGKGATNRHGMLEILKDYAAGLQLAV